MMIYGFRLTSYTQDVLKPINDVITVLSGLEVPPSPSRNAVTNVSVFAESVRKHTSVKLTLVVTI